MSEDHQQKRRIENIPTRGRNCSFPQKVHALLQYAQRNDLESVACWTADGKGFHIFSPNEFMEKIAPHFFPNHASFRSFERMLNLWGFIREGAPPPQKLFRNSSFQRDRPELCRHMSRNENKGTKQRVPLPGMQRYVHVKSNIPSWAKEHQQAALKYFSAQSTQQVEDISKAINRPRSGKKAGRIESQEEQQKWLQSQPGEPNELFDQTEGEDRHEGNNSLHLPYVKHQAANSEELGHPAFVRPLSIDATFRQQNEQTQAILPQDLTSSNNVNTCCTSHEWRVETESHVSSKSNEFLSLDTRSHSFSDENNGFETLRSTGSACPVKAFPEGQFDDAPDSLLVLANVAVSGSSEKDSCKKQR